MNLNILKNKQNSTEKSFAKNFIKELSDCIKNKSQKLQIEKRFYQVVDFGNESVFLKDLETNKIFEEKNIPKDLKDKIFNDCILKFEDGVYTIDQEKTDEFMDNMIDIKDLNRKEK